LLLRRPCFLIFAITTIKNLAALLVIAAHYLIGVMQMHRRGIGEQPCMQVNERIIEITGKLSHKSV